MGSKTTYWCDRCKKEINLHKEGLRPATITSILTLQVCEDCYASYNAMERVISELQGKIRDRWVNGRSIKAAHLINADDLMVDK
jgi:hypothetical protein